MNATVNKTKAPVRITREFFCYSAFFKNLVTNTTKRYLINIHGDSSFEWIKTGAIYLASGATPVANNAYMVPDIDLTIRLIGDDRPIYFNNSVNAMELVAPAGIAPQHATPVILKGRSTIEVTATSSYTDTIPYLILTFTGNKMFTTLPPPPPVPTVVKLVQ